MDFNPCNLTFNNRYDVYMHRSITTFINVAYSSIPLLVIYEFYDKSCTYDSTVVILANAVNNVYDLRQNKSTNIVSLVEINDYSKVKNIGSLVRHPT